MAITGSRCDSNMPAISVRDLQIKDDAKCRCADLIAGTHGRGFWILDDVDAASARPAGGEGPRLPRTSRTCSSPGRRCVCATASTNRRPWPPNCRPERARHRRVD
jgi:hypothetical protein